MKIKTLLLAVATVIGTAANAETIKFNAGVSFNECHPNCDISGIEDESVSLEYNSGSYANWTQEYSVNGEKLEVVVSVAQYQTVGYHFIVTAQKNQTEFEKLGDIFVPQPRLLNTFILQGRKFDLGGTIISPSVQISAAK